MILTPGELVRTSVFALIGRKQEELPPIGGFTNSI